MSIIKKVKSLVTTKKRKAAVTKTDKTTKQLLKEEGHKNV